MPASQMEYHLEKSGEEESNHVFLEARHRIPDGKLIATMQTCVRCRRVFHPERGRKYCPCCQGLLINKMIVLKAP